jgi:hypothetical protein
MTNDEIKAELTRRGVTFKARATKAELTALLDASAPPTRRETAPVETAPTLEFVPAFRSNPYAPFFTSENTNADRAKRRRLATNRGRKAIARRRIQKASRRVNRHGR